MMTYDVVTFANCLNEIICNQTPSQEALEYITELKTNSPNTMIDFLINIILDETMSPKIRLSAIKMLDVPFNKPKKGLHLMREEEKDQIQSGVVKIYNALKQYLFIEGEVGDALRINLAEIMIGIGLEMSREIAADVLTFLDQNTPLPVVTSVIKMIADARMLLKADEIRIIIEIAKHFNDKNLYLACFSTLRDSLLFLMDSDEDEHIVRVIAELVFLFAPEFPNEIYSIIQGLPLSKVVECDKRFSPFVIEMCFSDVKYHKYLQLIHQLELPADFDYVNFINYSFHCAVVELNSYSEEDEEEKVFPYYIERAIVDAITNVIELVSNEDNSYPLWDVYFKNIVELISSSDDAQLIIALEAYLVQLEKNRKITLERIDPRSILSALPEEKSEFLAAKYINLIIECITEGIVELSDEIIQNVFEISMSDNMRVEKAGFDAVMRISCNMVDEAKKFMWSLFANAAFENLDQANVFETCFSCMNTIAPSMSSDIAAECCSVVFEKAVQEYNENRESIVISKLIRCLCVLIYAAKASISEIALEIFNFASSIFDDFEDDALCILGPLCKIFGDSEIIVQCANVVVERMKNCDNTENFICIAKLAVPVILNSDNEDILIAILDNLYPFISSSLELGHFSTYESVSNIIFALYKRIPNVILDAVPNIVAQGYKFNMGGALNGYSCVELVYAIVKSSIAAGENPSNCYSRFLHGICASIKFPTMILNFDVIRPMITEIFTTYEGEPIKTMGHNIEILCEKFPENAALIQSKMEPFGGRLITIRAI